MRRLAIIALSLLLAGCDRRSNGPFDTPTWTLIEDQRIGSVEDDAKGFTRIEDLLVTRDRRILVRDNWIKLHVIDSTGRFVRQIGGYGSGPGEYERLDAFGLLADTVWVFDEQRHRITFYNREGEPLETFVMQAPTLADASVPTYPWTLMSDGSIVAAYGRRIPPDCKVVIGMLVRLQRRNGGTAGSLAMPSGGCPGAKRVSEPTLVVRDTIATYAIRDYQSATTVLKNYPGRSTPLHVYFPQPLADHTLRRAAHDGMTMVLVERSVATSPDTGMFAVTKLVFGDTALSRRYRYRPVAATDALIDSVLANTDEGRLYGMARDAVYHPRFRPPVSDVLLGTEGSVWLKREFSYSPTARWTVIDPSGEIAADVRIPASHELRAADADYVWTTVTDENDVPFIVRHRIVKPATTR